MRVFSEQGKKYSTRMKKVESDRKQTSAQYNDAKKTMHITWLAYVLEVARLVTKTGDPVTFYDPVQAGYPYAVTFEANRVIENYPKGDTEPRRIVEMNPVDYVMKLYNRETKIISIVKVKDALQQISESGFARRIRNHQVLINLRSFTHEKKPKE